MSKKKEWRCFHCDEVFTDTDAAAMHFGNYEFGEPACSVSDTELRKLQLELERYHDEDGPLHREIVRLESEIATRERRAEEEGYARGLADAQRYPEELELTKAVLQ